MTIEWPGLEISKDGKNVRPLIPMRVQVSSDESIVVPKHYASDGLTAPWFARLFIPRFGKYLWAALVHDFGYKNKAGRRKVDGWFKYRADKDGANPVIAFIAHIVLRLTGWVSYYYPNLFDKLLGRKA